MMKKEKKEVVPKTNSANIEDTLQAIKTKFGDDAIMKLGENRESMLTRYPLGQSDWTPPWVSAGFPEEG